MTIFVTFPGEGCAKKPIDGAHEVNNDTLFEGFHKPCFLSWVCGIEHEVVDIDADVDRSCRIGGGGVGSVDGALEETWVVERRLEAHVLESFGKHVVPVVRAAAKPVESFVE